MHELSIALNVIEIASRHVQGSLAGRRVEGVHLRLGPLSGVDPEALRFSFGLACRGTALDGARLLIEEVPLTVYCARCRGEHAVTGLVKLRCPVCGDVTPEVRGGDELEVTAIEVDGDAPTDR